MSVVRRFILNASWNVIGKVAVQVIYFALSVLISRYLGQTALGIYASLLVVPAVVRLFNTLGVESVINKKLPELEISDSSGAQARYLLKRMASVRTISTLIFSVLMYFSLPVYSEWVGITHLVEYRLALIAYFFVVAINSFWGVVFMARLKFKTVAITDTVNALVNLFLLIVFMMFDWGIGGVLYAYILSTLGQLLMYLYLARPFTEGPTQPTDFKEAKPLALAAYGINILSIGLWTQSDVLIMNLFHIDSAEVGFYHLATSLGVMVTFFLTGMGQLAQSLFSQRYTEEGTGALAHTWSMMLGFAIAATLPIGIFALAHGESIVTFIYGIGFQPAGPLFFLFLIFVLMATVLGSDLNLFVLFVLHKRNEAFRISVEGSVINVLLDILLIPKLGATGAVIATGSVMVYLVVRQLMVIGPSVKLPLPFGWMAKWALMGLAALIPGALADMFGMGHVIIQVLLFGLTFLIILTCVKPLSEEYRRELSSLLPGKERWFSAFSS